MLLQRTLFLLWNNDNNATPGFLCIQYLYHEFVMHCITNKTKRKSLDNIIWPQTIKDKQTTDLLAKNDAWICYFLICHPVVGCGYLALKVQHFCFIAIIWRNYFDTFTLIMYIRIGFVESLENWQARDNKHSAFNRTALNPF